MSKYFKSKISILSDYGKCSGFSSGGVADKATGDIHLP
jgi:hypothetical protein